MRTCSKCGVQQPGTTEFFYKDSARADGLKGECKECWNRRRRERRAQMTPEEIEAERRISRLKARAKRADPEGRARLNELSRESRRRKRGQPAKRKQEREARRLRHRLAEEQKGRDVEQMRKQEAQMLNSRADTEGAFPRLPAWPLGEVILEADRQRRRNHYSGCLVDFDAESGGLAGLALSVPGWSENADRSVRAWAVGEREEVNFDVVDRVLTALEWCWWDVYNPQTVRKHVLVVTVRSPSTSRKRIPKRRLDTSEMCAPYALDEHGIYGSPLPTRASKYITTRRRRVGDEGPDEVLLEQIRHTFECTGYPSCETCREQRSGEQVQMVLGEAA
jgi:hypothetical protein